MFCLKPVGPDMYVKAALTHPINLNIIRDHAKSFLVSL